MPCLFLLTQVAPHGSRNDYQISSNGDTIVFAARVPGREKAWKTNIDIYLVPTDGSQPPVAISRPNEGADSSPRFSPDGKSIIWLSMRTPGYESDQNKLMLYTIESKKTRMIMESWDRSPEEVHFVSSGQLVVAAQDTGRLLLFSIDIKSETKTALTTNGSMHSWSIVDQSVLGLADSMTSPARIVSIDILARQITQLVSRNDVSLMIEPSEFWFTGADDSQVHGWLVKPYGYDPKKTYPLAFLIHGGPEGAWNDDFGYRWNPQVWAGAGYFVAMINPQGSTGYGQEFTKAILGNWGGAPYQTLMKGLDTVLANNPQIDPRRVAVRFGYIGSWSQLRRVYDQLD